MKRLHQLLLCAGVLVSTSALAFTPDCCIQNYLPGLCSPKLPGGFYFGITGYHLKPSETGLGQSTDSWQFLENSDPTNLVFRAEDRSTRPKADWEWGITAGYDLPCTPYNVEASYLHLRTDKHAVNENNGDPITFASITITNALIPFDTGEGTFFTDVTSDAHLKYDLDQGDLKIGRQFFDNCRTFKAQVSVGARYANIKHNLIFDSPGVLNIVTEGPTIVIDARTFGAYKSDFKGIGPLAALDLRYGLTCGLGLVGHFNSALLIGHVDSSNIITQEGTIVEPEVLPPTFTTNRYTRPSLSRVVPNVDAKLGVDYTHCFCNGSGLTLEVGYSANKFWDTFDLIRGDSANSTTPLTQRVTDVATNSFAFHGPYATLSYHL